MSTPSKIGTQSERDHRTPQKRPTKSISGKATALTSLQLNEKENIMHNNNATTDETASTTSGADSIVDVLVENSSEENVHDVTHVHRRRSGRVPSPTKKFLSGDFIVETVGGSGGKRKDNQRKRVSKNNEITDDEENEEEHDDDIGSEYEAIKPKGDELQLIQEDAEVAGKIMFGFNTPKKKGAMALAVMNTPKTPATPKTPGRLGKTPDGKKARKSSLDPKTPSRVRSKVKSRK